MSEISDGRTNSGQTDDRWTDAGPWVYYTLFLCKPLESAENGKTIPRKNVPDVRVDLVNLADKAYTRPTELLRRSHKGS